MLLEVPLLQTRFVLIDPNSSIGAIGVVIGTLTLTIVHYSVEIVAFTRTATIVVVQTSILLQVLPGFLVPFLLLSFITSRLIKDQD
jgi:mannose/fructose/N-acetylgalactosamine-specific phosphotransferase system component IID